MATTESPRRGYSRVRELRVRLRFDFGLIFTDHSTVVESGMGNVARAFSQFLLRKHHHLAVRVWHTVEQGKISARRSHAARLDSSGVCLKVK